MDGLLRCSRYAFGPNRLHYCGPDANRELFGYIKESAIDAGLQSMLTQFRTMYPYLRRIAASNGIKDPFDSRVVEAYWIGNRLLENVDRRTMFNHLVADHGLKKRLPSKSFDQVAGLVGKGALPHHSFHVFSIWKRTGHAEKAQTLESMDSCRISWGSVLEADGPALTVKRRPLVIDGGKLALGDAVTERFLRIISSPDDIEGAKRGDIVTLHWSVPCEVISPRQASDLKRFTLKSVALANLIL